jgi:predicted nucleotidyltransferase
MDWSNYKTITRDLSKIQELRNGRGVSRFEDFPENTRIAYEAIAKRFPDVQVYACGSRVRGDYVEIDSPASILEARRLAGMRNKPYSDYDFVVADHKTQPIYDLPAFADRVYMSLPENEMVAVPIAQRWKDSPYDFEKIPKEEYAGILTALRARNGEYLREIHDRYKLSEYSYCCGTVGIVPHFMTAKSLFEGK